MVLKRFTVFECIHFGEENTINPDQMAPKETVCLSDQG